MALSGAPQGAGGFRQVITIQQPVKTQNGYGEQSTDYLDFLTTRASYEPLTGREFFDKEQITEQIDVYFRVRYNSCKNVTSNMVVLYRGIVYQIMYDPINPDGQQKQLLLGCKKI